MAGLGLTNFETIAMWAVLGVAILGLLYAIFLRSQILREDMGTPKMQEVWNAIREGADAYLTRQLRRIVPLIAVLTVALFLSVYIVPPTEGAREWYCTTFEGVAGSDREGVLECAEGLNAEENPADYNQIRLLIGIARAVAFVMGAGFSLTVGQIGMRMAVQGNVRVASASRRSFGDALRIAYRTGWGCLAVRLSLSCWVRRPRMRCWALALGGRCWRCLCVWVAVFTQRRPTWALTWWVRWKRVFLRTTRATRQ
jgi:K(+)-stimulated pyrophosphate-energized sodium pump